MKTSKTRVSSIALLLLTVCMVIGLASCDLVSNLICQHQWKDATCTTPKTCSLCQKTEGEALGHSGGTATCSQKAVCSVCNTEYGDFAAHAFTEEVVKDEALKSAATCTSAAIYYKSCTCGAVSTNDADIFQSGRIGRHQYGNSTVCTLCGFDAGDLYYYNFAESFTTTKGISLKIENFVYEVETNDPTPNNIPQKVTSVDIAELELYYENGELGGAAHGAINMAYFGSSVKAHVDFSAIISEGYLYFSITDGNSQNIMHKYSVEELLEEILSAYMGKSSDEASARDVIIPFVIDTALPAVIALIEDNKTDVNKALERTLNIIFTFEKQADGSVLVKLSKDKLLALNEALATKSVAEVIDTYYGEGAFNLVVDFAYEILDLKISEIPAYLKDKGIDYDDLIAKLQDLSHELGNPAKGEEGYVDINEQITNSENSNTVLANLLIPSIPEEYDNYKAAIEGEVLPVLRTNTPYELMGYTEEFKSQADDTITEIFGYINPTVTTNAAGEFTAINVNVNKMPFGGHSQSSGTQTISYNYYISFSLEILANGKINVTWGDIVDDYNNAVAPIPDSIKKDLEFNIDSDEYSDGYVYFQGEELYLDYRFWVRVSKTDLDANVLPTINKNCGNWNYYSLYLPVEYYSFNLYCITPEAQEFYINNAEGETVKITNHSNGWRATFENGETKELATMTNGKTLVQLAAEFIPAIFEDYIEQDRGWSEHVEYYYNTATGEYAFEEQHNWTYDFDMFGDSCDDGYDYTQTCSKCNATIIGTGDGHFYDDTEIDLSEHGMCGGTVEKRECHACGESHMYTYDHDCSWEWQNADNDGYIVSKCIKCNAIRKYKITYGEKNENCEYTITKHYIYILNDKEICNETAFYTSTDHNFQNTYQLQGETCLEGVLVSSHCSDCGYVSETDYMTYGHTDAWKKIELDDLGLCGGYVEERYCPACEVIANIDSSDYVCYWQPVGYVDGYNIYKCENCGATKKTKSFLSEKDENCQYTQIETLIYIVNGQEVYRGEEISCYDDHNITYSYEKLGTTCRDGVTVTKACSNCSLCESWETHGHVDNEPDYTTVGVGTCFNGFVWEQYCEACGDLYGFYFYDYCDNSEIVSQTDTTSVRKCNDCNATITEINTSSEHTLIIEIDGVEVYNETVLLNK